MKAFIRLVIALLMSVLLFESSVVALSQTQRNLIDSGIGWFDAVETSNSACSLPSNTVQLAGNDNYEKVWNYLISQNIFEPHHVAGIMGNMVVESGVNPRRVQEVASIEGATGESDTPHPNPSVGYGLVQWTPGTQLLEPAAEAGLSPGDLGFQLDYLMHELFNEEKRALDHLLETTNVDDATVSFMLKFERPKDQSTAAQQKRIPYGQEILARFAGFVSNGSSPVVIASECGPISRACELPVSLPMPESTREEWFNYHNHGTSVSWPDRTNGHNTVIYDTANLVRNSGVLSDTEVGEAVDIGVAAGTKVFAPFDGEVRYAGLIHRGGYDGYMIAINSSNGKCSTLLAHTNRPLVSVGENVTVGQEIGTIADITNDHLHFELLIDGVPVNIGLDEAPCIKGVVCTDNYQDEAQEIWELQKEVLQGGVFVAE